MRELIREVIESVKELKDFSTEKRVGSDKIRYDMIEEIEKKLNRILLNILEENDLG